MMHCRRTRPIGGALRANRRQIVLSCPALGRRLHHRYAGGSCITIRNRPAFGAVCEPCGCSEPLPEKDHGEVPNRTLCSLSH